MLYKTKQINGKEDLPKVYMKVDIKPFSKEWWKAVRKKVRKKYDNAENEYYDADELDYNILSILGRYREIEIFCTIRIDNAKSMGDKFQPFNPTEEEMQRMAEEKYPYSSLKRMGDVDLKREGYIQCLRDLKGE